MKKVFNNSYKIKMIKYYIELASYILMAIIILFLPLISFAEDFNERYIAYIYQDDGVSAEALAQTFSTLKENLPNKYYIKTIDAKEVVQNRWVKDAALFVMPGGADLSYAKKLNGRGNQNIKNFVKNGGAYLGICAGAYYGASYVEFDKGGDLEVIGKRELAFFPGKAVGPILAKYNYKNNSGARAAKLIIPTGKIKECNVYYNGGGFFAHAENYHNVSVIAYYQLNLFPAACLLEQKRCGFQRGRSVALPRGPTRGMKNTPGAVNKFINKKLPAIIDIDYGQGKVILSGVHFEYNAFLLDSNDQNIKKIIPDLKQSAAARKALIQEIFTRLKLYT